MRNWAEYYDGVMFGIDLILNTISDGGAEPKDAARVAKLWTNHQRVLHGLEEGILDGDELAPATWYLDGLLMAWRQLKTRLWLWWWRLMLTGCE